MTNIYKILYNVFFLPLLYCFFLLYSLFNEKVKRGLKERRAIFTKISAMLNELDTSKKLVWFHSSSMGEFEQAKPIIEKLKGEHDINILVTFFSPSGYENSLKYPQADIVSYIPFDKLSTMKKFVELISPSLAVFMRYDIWPNSIWALKNAKVPMMIVDATMRTDSKRALPFLRGFHKELFGSFDKILTVSKSDEANFKKFVSGENKVETVGDTRFDRVYGKSLQAKERKLFRENFFEDKKVFVFGSSWEADEEVVFPALNKLLAKDDDVIAIVVPHEPTIQHLEKIEHTFNGTIKTIRFSFLNNYDNERIIIIDSIGILLTLYYYADAAYVGGSFKQGVHNVLEPAVYGIPVLFGPKIENSQEAMQLSSIGAGYIIKNRRDIYRRLRTFFNNGTEREKAGRISHDYVNKHLGATDKITGIMNNYLR